MRFGPWYPLAEAGDHTPEGENVLQLRIASGLVDYPRGKSAMVRYAHVPDARATAIAFAVEHADRDLWCRHLVEHDGDFGRLLAKLHDEFVRRFGQPPGFAGAPQATGDRAEGP